MVSTLLNLVKVVAISALLMITLAGCGGCKQNDAKKCVNNYHIAVLDGIVTAKGDLKGDANKVICDGIDDYASCLSSASCCNGDYLKGFESTKKDYVHECTG